MTTDELAIVRRALDRAAEQLETIQEIREVEHPDPMLQVAKTIAATANAVGFLCAALEALYRHQAEEKGRVVTKGSCAEDETELLAALAALDALPDQQPVGLTDQIDWPRQVLPPLVSAVRVLARQAVSSQHPAKPTKPTSPSDESR